VTLRENLKIPDGNIENTNDNRLKLIRSIREYRPTTIIFPFAFDRHPDHENAHRLCREAWFFAGLEKIETTFSGRRQQPHRPRAWINFMQWYEFTPSFIVDITDEYDQRMKAVHAFKSQFYDPDNRERETALSSPEFLEMLRTRCEYYGDKIGRKYGEPFFSPTPIGIIDFDSLII
jgi:bacillithiol biosynthesis deacetylase BshB1